MFTKDVIPSWNLHLLMCVQVEVQGLLGIITLFKICFKNGRKTQGSCYTNFDCIKFESEFELHFFFFFQCIYYKQALYNKYICQTKKKAYIFISTDGVSASLSFENYIFWSMETEIGYIVFGMHTSPIKQSTRKLIFFTGQSVW